MKSIDTGAIGKTVSEVEIEEGEDHPDLGHHDVLTIVFTDGSRLIVSSWDPSQYASGLDIEASP